MKTYIISLLLLYFGFECLSQSKSILVTTSFNGFHCDGKQGICDIDNTSRSQSNSTLVWNLNNTLTITVARENLTALEQQKITGINPNNLNLSKTYYFNISQSYLLPYDIKELLSKNGSQISLAKGSYPILITKDTFTITFNLE